MMQVIIVKSEPCTNTAGSIVVVAKCLSKFNGQKYLGLHVPLTLPVGCMFEQTHIPKTLIVYLNATCSVTEKAAEIEKTISAKDHKSQRYDFDPTMFYKNRFWNQRPDGTVMDKNHRTLCILELERSSDRNEDFLRVKEDEANQQHNSIIEAIKAAAPKWTFEQLNFCGREAWCSS